MALTILNSTHSFVRFGEAEPTADCIWGTTDFCLPVFDEADISFQFVIQGTEDEINSMCTLDASEIELSIVPECDGTELLIFTEKPQRFRLSTTQILYNWEHGLPGFAAVVAVGSCFKLQILVTEIYGYPETVTFCSNCFERIGSDCFTSVIEYGSTADAFGFKYCLSGDIEGTGVGEDCSPTIVEFINQATLSIPYTTGLEAKYGEVPTVQVWVYDGTGQLLNMGITAAFDSIPVSFINLDFGGVASGIVVIR
jgi:hypothetical protein